MELKLEEALQLYHILCMSTICFWCVERRDKKLSLWRIALTFIMDGQGKNK